MRRARTSARAEAEAAAQTGGKAMGARRLAAHRHPPAVGPGLLLLRCAAVVRMRTAAARGRGPETDPVHASRGSAAQLQAPARASATGSAASRLGDCDAERGGVRPNRGPCSGLLDGSSYSRAELQRSSPATASRRSRPTAVRSHLQEPWSRSTEAPPLFPARP